MTTQTRSVAHWANLDRHRRSAIIAGFYTSNNQATAHALLSLVKAPRGYGVYASTGPNYHFSIFGRDSIAVAEDILESQPKVAKEIIFLLAKLQGKKVDNASEEEPGKIPHEYRARKFSHAPFSRAAAIMLDTLKIVWGGTEDQLLYYGAFDATPLFVRLVDRYCEKYGRDILDEIVVDRDHKRKPLREHVYAAVKWTLDKVYSSPWQLLEFKRLNPLGLYNQSWKDSNTAYLHVNGSAAQSDSGIAAIELQGYAYDALMAGARLVSRNMAEANTWHAVARTIQVKTLELLWLPDQAFFAQGADRDENNALRHIATLTSNPALLLDTGLLKDLQPETARPYVEGIARMIMSEEFLTVAGIRCRAKRHIELVPFADYHGSQVTWPHDTWQAAKGLRRHGYEKLAAHLENCILESVQEAGEFYEFFFVTLDGRAKYHYRQEARDEPTSHDFGAANKPEPGQAWTISAVLGIINGRHLQARKPRHSEKEAVKTPS
ncbi:MAG: amylo-alpha-1,6-glucosidase [Candidatus Saccharimonadales bacterium]